MWANKNVGDPTKWTYDPDLLSRPSTTAVEEHVRAADVAGDATQQDQRLVGYPVFLLALRAGRRRFGAWLWGADQVARRVHQRRKPPELVDASELDLADHARASCSKPTLQLGPYFWWGARQKNSFDKTFIPVQEDAGIIPGINYRAAPWSGHTGYTNIVQGSASYVTGSHSAKLGGSLPQNDSNVSDQLLQRFPAQVQLHERLSQPIHDVRGPGVAAATAADPFRAVRAGSMDDRAAYRCRAVSASST